MVDGTGKADAALRAHHLLCLFAFVGEGYSKAFVKRFARLRELYEDPNSLLEIRAAPDDACQVCPFLGERGCNSDADGPEDTVEELDRTVLRLLDLRPGIRRAGEIHARLDALDFKDLHAACSSCSWYGKLECQKLIADVVERLTNRGPGT